MPQPCELCQREISALTEHHLIPRQKTKRKGLDPSPTIQICSACHRQIHTLYDNSHLALYLNTLEKLKQDPQLQKFLCWVHKQDPNKRVKIDRKR
jgi:SPX domain protein involved in polyphosphate accumulation